MPSTPRASPSAWLMTCCSPPLSCCPRPVQSFELPRAIHIESEPFSVANDLLTPTFELRRAALLKKYKRQVGHAIRFVHSIVCTGLGDSCGRMYSRAPCLLAAQLKKYKRQVGGGALVAFCSLFLAQLSHAGRPHRHAVVGMEFGQVWPAVARICLLTGPAPIHPYNPTQTHVYTPTDRGHVRQHEEQRGQGQGRPLNYRGSRPRRAAEPQRLRAGAEGHFPRGRALYGGC